jgi:hypothetical protein
MMPDLPDMGEGWRIHYALFGRQGFTDSAKSEMRRVGGVCVDLKHMDAVLRKME